MYLFLASKMTIHLLIFFIKQDLVNFIHLEHPEPVVGVQAKLQNQEQPKLERRLLVVVVEVQEVEKMIFPACRMVVGEVSC